MFQFQLAGIETWHPGWHAEIWAPHIEAVLEYRSTLVRTEFNVYKKRGNHGNIYTGLRDAVHSTARDTPTPRKPERHTGLLAMGNERLLPIFSRFFWA